MARLLAIDYGDSRIGIALTDPLQIIASAYKTIQNTKDSYQMIAEICLEKDVEAIVMGIPFNQDDGIGDAALKVLNFSKKLILCLGANNLDIPFYEQDERYSTREAHSAMRSIKIKTKKKQGLVDQIAAANILKSFMESSYKTKLNIEKYLNEA